MDNTNQFEDFDVQVNDVPQSNVEEAPVETPVETVNSEEPVVVETEEPASQEETSVPEDAVEPAEVVEPVETEVVVEEEPAQPKEDAEALVKSLLEQIENLSRQNELLQKKFDQKIAQDEHKAQLFDKMYAELQSYKTDLYAKLLKPFVLSTITLLDDTNTFLGKLGENESVQAEKFLRTMPDDLIEILEANGVVLYEDDSDKFNPKTQRVVKQVPTDKPELENTIAKRVRKGYSWNGVNLKPEMVWIYKFKPEA